MTGQDGPDVDCWRWSAAGHQLVPCRRGSRTAAGAGMVAAAGMAAVVDTALAGTAVAFAAAFAVAVAAAAIAVVAGVMVMAVRRHAASEVCGTDF